MSDLFFEITFAFRELITQVGGWIADLDPTSPTAFAAVAVAGLVMALTPSSLPLVPVIVGFVIGRNDETLVQPSKWRGAILSIAFVLGMATVDATIGALFGILGYYVLTSISSYLGLANLFIALLLAFLGLALMRIVVVKLPAISPVFRPAESIGGAYLLGIPFGLSVCPACSPLVLPILSIAATTGSPWIAAALLFVFGLGRGTLIIIAGAMAGNLKSLDSVSRWIPVIEKAGGVLLLIFSAYFLYQSAMYAGYVPPLIFLI